MKKVITVFTISAMIMLCAGCANGGNTESNSSPQITANPNEAIYDAALDYAYDGEFDKAISKLKTLSEPYSDSDSVLETLETGVTSSFIGIWYCPKNKSCNDMEITLTIYPVYRSGEMKLAFERDMDAGAGKSGSSNITGTISLPTSNSTTVSRLNSAEWNVSGSTLKEIFEDGKKNTYTRQ